jgi:hypothetical protein
MGVDATGVSIARSTFDFHKALGTEGFNEGDDGYVELVKSLEDAGYDDIAPGTMRNNQIAKRLGFDNFEDASSSSNTEKLKTRYQTMQNTIKYAKSLEETGKGASFDYSNLIFTDDDTASRTDPTVIGADRYGGGTYMGTDKDGGSDVYSADKEDPYIESTYGKDPTHETGQTEFPTVVGTGLKRPKLRPSNVSVVNGKTVTDWNKADVGNLVDERSTFNSNKGGLATRPKKTKKKTKAYKKGGLASKK